MFVLIAQQAHNLGGIFGGLGPLGNTSGFTADVSPAAALFNRVMSIIIGFLTVVAGLWFVFQFLIGAFSWLTAGGDKAKIQAAQAKITTSILGLAIVIIAIFLIDLIGTLLGLNILSPADFIINVWNPGGLV